MDKAQEFNFKAKQIRIRLLNSDLDMINFEGKWIMPYDTFSLHYEGHLKIIWHVFETLGDKVLYL